MGKEFDAEAKSDGVPNPSGLGLLLVIIIAATCTIYLKYNTAHSKALASVDAVKEASDSSACMQTKIQEYLRMNEPLQNYQLDNLRAVCSDIEETTAKLEQQKNAVSGQNFK